MLNGSDTDTDHQNKMGFTALMHASENGHEDCVKELLDADANVELRNENGESALDLARSSGHHAIARILRRALHFEAAKRKAEEVVQEQKDNAIEAHKERLEQARAALESVDASSRIVTRRHASRRETMLAEVRKLERELDELEELPLDFNEYEGGIMLLEEYELFGIEWYLEDFAQYYAQYYEDADTENFDADAFVQWVQTGGPVRDVDMGPSPDDDDDDDDNDDAGDDDAAN